ncbi:MAG: oligosaccharide flippase family protein, partial [Polyangiaceae bacterium]
MPEVSAQPEATDADRCAAREDAIAAFRGAVTLGASLAGTWSVALVVRIVLPRWLGPSTFGALNFAESFTAALFVLLGLGVETYIQKEIPVRPGHASDFFGGLVVARVVMTAGLLVAMEAALEATHRSAAVHRLVLVFGAGQLLFAINGSLAALLQAARDTWPLAAVNVVAKLAWGAGVLLALVLHATLEGIASAFVVSEVVRLVVLYRLAHRRLGLRMRVDRGALRAAIVSSMPYYVNAVACTMYGRVDVTMLSLLSNDTEVGWYGAASNFAALALLLSPLVGWVLLPMLSRAAARSSEELFVIVRRAIEAVVLIALPIALLIDVGADVWLPHIFGEAFVPAVLSLRLLAPVLIFTYVAMIAATALVLLERPWTVAILSLGGLALNLTLDLVLIRPASRAWGPGGAGAGAAIALFVTEVTVTGAMVIAVGRRAFDRRSLRVTAGGAVAAALVLALDRAIQALCGARLAVDAVAWLALALAFRV